MGNIYSDEPSRKTSPSQPPASGKAGAILGAPGTPRANHIEKFPDTIHIVVDGITGAGKSAFSIALADLIARTDKRYQDMTRIVPRQFDATRKFLTDYSVNEKDQKLIPAALFFMYEMKVHWSKVDEAKKNDCLPILEPHPIIISETSDAAMKDCIDLIDIPQAQRQLLKLVLGDEPHEGADVYFYIDTDPEMAAKREITHDKDGRVDQAALHKSLERLYNTYVGRLQGPKRKKPPLVARIRAKNASGVYMGPDYLAESAYDHMVQSGVLPRSVDVQTL